jgi:outer membrane protein TolC
MWWWISLAQAEPIRLEAALSEAAARGPGARVAELALEQGRAELQAAGLLAEGPRLEWVQDHGAAELVVGLPLDAGMGARARLRHEGGQELELRQRLLSLEPSAAVAVAWLGLEKTGQDLALARDERDQAEQLLSNARRMQEAGELNIIDLMLIQAAAQEAGAALRAAEEAERAASSGLERLLGRAPAGALRAEGNLELPPPAEPSVALRQEQARRAAAAGRAAQGAERWSELGLELKVGQHQDRLDGHRDPVVGLEWTAPLAAGRRGRVHQASASQALLEVELGQQLAELAEAQVQAESRLAQAELHLAELRALPLEAAWRAHQARAAGGELPVTQLLDERDRLIHLRHALLDARLEVQEARLSLWLLSGALPPLGP